jgi:hypothetical protein
MLKAGTVGRLVAFATIGVGLLIIGLGYNGIAGESLDARAQLPYLLSGGFLGLAVVVFGTGLLINHSAREDRARMESVLAQLLDAQLGTSSAAPVPSTADGLYAAGTASFHEPSCRLVAGREQVDYVTAAKAAALALKPCRVCLPQGAPIS